MNQFTAGQANFIVFSRNLLPLLDEQGAKQMQMIQASFATASQSQMRRVMAAKLGVAETHANFDALVKGCAAPNFTTEILFH
jgi:uncharacterized protein YdiU (UPF0061 family)